MQEHLIGVTLLKEINIFIQRECINLIKSDSKDLHC